MDNILCILFMRVRVCFVRVFVQLCRGVTPQCQTPYLNTHTQSYTHDPRMFIVWLELDARARYVWYLSVACPSPYVVVL